MDEGINQSINQWMKESINQWLLRQSIKSRLLITDTKRDLVFLWFRVALWKSKIIWGWGVTTQTCKSNRGYRQVCAQQVLCMIDTLELEQMSFFLLFLHRRCEGCHTPFFPSFHSSRCFASAVAVSCTHHRGCHRTTRPLLPRSLFLISLFFCISFFPFKIHKEQHD